LGAVSVALIPEFGVGLFFNAICPVGVDTAGALGAVGVGTEALGWGVKLTAPVFFGEVSPLGTGA
jgi:hypothetical protein